MENRKMIFAFVVAGVFAFGAIVCYSSCVVGARADRQSEEYFRLKEMENYHGKHFRDE